MLARKFLYPHTVERKKKKNFFKIQNWRHETLSFPK